MRDIDPQKDTPAESINAPCAYNLSVLPFGSRLNLISSAEFRNKKEGIK